VKDYTKKEASMALSDELEALAKRHGALSYRNRASHGQAPAQAAPVCGSPADLPPLPDPDLRDVGTKPEDIKNFLRGYATEYAKAALASSAPADSVLEDAAQVEIDLFNDLNRIYGNTLTAYAKEMCRLGYRKTNAARKQGETNEH
jgi:hypothetical protein